MKKYLLFAAFITLIFTGYTNSTLKPISNAKLPTTVEKLPYSSL